MMMSEKMGDEMSEHLSAVAEAEILEEQIIYTRAVNGAEAMYQTTDGKQFFYVARAECHQRSINRGNK